MGMDMDMDMEAIFSELPLLENNLSHEIWK